MGTLYKSKVEVLLVDRMLLSSVSVATSFYVLCILLLIAEMAAMNGHRTNELSGRYQAWAVAEQGADEFALLRYQ